MQIFMNFHNFSSRYNLISVLIKLFMCSRIKLIKIMLKLMVMLFGDLNSIKLIKYRRFEWQVTFSKILIT